MSAHVTIYRELAQGSEEWLQLRCGMLTASEMKLIITPATLKAASNIEERTHLYDLAAQRIRQYVEPSFQSYDMERGKIEEIEARRYYSVKYQDDGPVEEVGFIVNTRHGFRLGYSPDGLVGTRGQLEAKSRKPKFQVQTIVEHLAIAEGKTIPPEFLIQIQTGLIASERDWCDFLSFSGGLPMARIRVFPDPKVRDAILEAATAFEKRISERIAQYQGAVRKYDLIPTQRILFGEIETDDDE